MATDGKNWEESNMTVNGKEEYNATKLRKVTWELTTKSISTGTESKDSNYNYPYSILKIKSKPTVRRLVNISILISNHK